MPSGAVAALLALVVVAAVGWSVMERNGRVAEGASASPSPSRSVSASVSPSPSPSRSPSPPASPTPGPINTAFEGITTFRGNATRTYYGDGPVPRRIPEILWRYPRSGSLCSDSTVANETKT
ncbi:MAG TPA: hypothetical protein VFR44_11705, partial [Actinomycetota bacterium]|nr:hypothetical protein [Actinomycetota bacterium]